jgi:predicted nucleic acid-binding protein
MSSDDSPPTSLILDASAAIDLLINGAGAFAAPHLVDTHIHVPSHFAIEVVSGFRRMWLAGALSDERFVALALASTRLPVTERSLTTLVPRILSLSRNFTAYDAGYVALAEAMDAPLLTIDKRLAASAQTHVTVIEVDLSP